MTDTPYLLLAFILLIGLVWSVWLLRTVRFLSPTWTAAAYTSGMFLLGLAALVTVLLGG